MFVAGNIRILILIEKLKTLSGKELTERWQKLFGTNLPLNAKKDLLIKHAAWQIQAKKYGGYSAQTKKQLDKLIKTQENDEEETCRQSSFLEIKPGTKLIREYKGEKHEVLALEKGFNYKDKRYNSLSGIANEITGTRWNGKVFFGVKK